MFIIIHCKSTASVVIQGQYESVKTSTVKAADNGCQSDPTPKPKQAHSFRLPLHNTAKFSLDSTQLDTVQTIQPKEVLKKTNNTKKTVDWHVIGSR